MKIYGVATKGSYREHGGGGKYTQITPMGSYYSGDMPPFFKTKEEAQKFIEDKDFWCGEVIECELIIKGVE